LESDIAKLDKMFMCGDYGDPAAGRHTMDIYRYFRSVNPDITLGMNTNGAIQNTSWWRSLGEIFQHKQDYVVFSIDGLEDTNHIYRRGVNWQRLMENAEAYISTGANAHWDMLIYRHNEHQVDQCEKLARSMGFTWFRAKVSKRRLYGDLEMPVNWTAPVARKGKINCHVLNEQSIYIDAQGRQSPCCWLGARQKDFIHDIQQVMSTWDSDQPNPICRAVCGTDLTQSNFTAQFRREVELC
jgi:sulfatase maturation enzyme AslB (radical SAM superfamily)